MKLSVKKIFLGLTVLAVTIVFAFILINLFMPTKSKKDIKNSGVKVVGYYPDWQPQKHDRIQYNVLTHINYAFAIPKPDGTLRPLDNPENAKKIIEQAHKNNVKVLIAIGGWSYEEIPLEDTFVEATQTKEKINLFVKSIMEMVEQYGFDGVDMDWEHPRAEDASQYQYESLMLALRKELTAKKLLLTTAVLSGVNNDGVVYNDSAAHTKKVLDCVDWINVMAYGEVGGDMHSSFEFAKNSVLYWRETRGLDKQKIMLGVPFFGRPTWTTYDMIIQANANANKADKSLIDDTMADYNGADTIKSKTKWAKENCGGIMIWEISQDALDKNKSLLSVIGKALK